MLDEIALFYSRGSPRWKLGLLVEEGNFAEFKTPILNNRTFRWERNIEHKKPTGIKISDYKLIIARTLF